MRSKVSTTVYLTREQDAALKLLSDTTKIPAAALLREALSEWLTTGGGATRLARHGLTVPKERS